MIYIIQLEKTISRKECTKRYCHDVFQPARFHNNFARCGIVQFAYTFKHLLSNKLELQCARDEERSGTEIGNCTEKAVGEDRKIDREPRSYESRSTKEY